MNETTWLMAKTHADDEMCWLPLSFHLRDTASVMAFLAKEWVPQALRRATGLGDTAFLSVAAFLALVHDLGKGTPVFQRKLLGRFPEIEAAQRAQGIKTPNALSNERWTPHGLAGAELLRKAGCPESVALIVGAHHGRTESQERWPLENLNANIVNYYGREDQSAWERAHSQIISQALRGAGYKTMSEVPELSLPAQMLLCGLLIMADWIASDTAFFPLLSLEDDAEAYPDVRGPCGIARLHLPLPWQVADFWSGGDLIHQRFGFMANTVQQAVEQVATTVASPGMMILEAPMGVGKTEAALGAAEILLNRFQLGGVAFFLPSQATSNAMFTRLMTWATSQPDADRLSVRLVHAMAEMNDEFAALAEGTVRVEEDAPNPAEALTVHAFFRGRKTSLLADVVIGTVDQLLMAGLLRKHVMLRHLGLAGKVVVVDECHAYDAYMNRYLDRVLGWLGAYGVPVILLSATLPGKRRAELLAAYFGRARLGDESIAKGEDYPLLSWTDGNSVHRQVMAAPAAAMRVRMVQIRQDALTAAVSKALEAEGCVGIILNTVRSLQETAEVLKETFPQATLLIDHSQFLMPDRLQHEAEILERVGKRSTPAERARVIVLGTQVLEQSLDLDFDLLITDLCPMDLLLQRIGRLHRHQRQRPLKLAEPCCLVMHADALEPGACAVYGEYLLLRTKMLLPDAILLPNDISPLVQRTYDEARCQPEGDPVYDKARAEYFQQQKRLHQKAEAYLISRPDMDDLCEVLTSMPGMSDPQAQAAVRDGVSSIEVLVVRMVDGMAELIAGGDAGLRIPMDHEPDRQAARALAKQRLRLPGRFSRSWNVEQNIDWLQCETERLVPEWLHSPLLQGELFLFLNGSGEGKVNGTALVYDRQRGMCVKEDEHGTN